ncbi:MAG: hypothetical protein HFK08_05355, partial [Clostridia bacterium]|nr:hypothetical protein [Clostridia bacterium]
DEVIAIEKEKADCTLMFVTKGGMCLNADMSDIPLQGRVAGGVKGIQLSDGDSCLFIGQVNGDGEIALVTDRSFCKRVLVSQLDVMSRYRKGVKIIDFGKSGGTLVFASYVTLPYKVVFVMEDGYMTAFSTENFPIENRTHAGRALLKGKMNVANGLVYNDKVQK